MSLILSQGLLAASLLAGTARSGCDAIAAGGCRRCRCYPLLGGNDHPGAGHDARAADAAVAAVAIDAAGVSADPGLFQPRGPADSVEDSGLVQA